MLSVDDVALPHVVTIPVMGLPTRFATNEPAMLEIVDEAFGVWSALDGHDVLDADTHRVVHVRIAVGSDDRDDELDARGAPVSHAVSYTHLTLPTN